MEGMLNLEADLAAAGVSTALDRLACGLGGSRPTGRPRRITGIRPADHHRHSGSVLDHHC